jgi:hypothetical protein
MQSRETCLQLRNREFFENFRKNRLAGDPWSLVVENSKEIQITYTVVWALSCYCADQAV